MRHFYRTTLTPAEAIEAADAFFTALGLQKTSSGPRARTFRGVVGSPEVTATVQITARAEGGHYTFVEATTDQMGESRLDRNVKRFFVSLRRRADPSHALEAAY
ncbi:MAG: hypothetical protein HUU26_13060 [Gemmatimonadaceae bacterium]|nr:hypothetical protein [Gemmatimonadaceae bacterium]